MAKRQLADQDIQLLCADKRGGTNGEQDRLRNPVWETKACKLLAVKPVGVAVGRETPNLTGESIGGAHRILDHTYTSPPTQESTPEGPNLLVRSKESD